MSDTRPTLLSRCLSALNPFRIDTPDDRRRATRIRGNAIACSLGEIQDISATGARIRCRRLYRPYEGNSVTLQIQPTGETPRITLRGTVCWTTCEDGHWFAGVAFTGMSEADARVLGTLVSDNAPAAYSAAA
jgi:hypothetical protein